MKPAVSEVLSGERPWWCEFQDCLEFMAGLPDKSVDLVFGSPPYEDLRWYAELNFKPTTEEWVAWMVKVFQAAERICKGLCALVVGHGKTEDWRWSGAPALLQADLVRAGFHLRNPPVYYRNGVSGSGQKDWLRADYETIVCVSGAAKDLPWANNTALGHRPKFGPGGDCTNRTANGNRRNQWGGTDQSGSTRRANGTRQKPGRPSHKTGHTARQADGTTVAQSYQAPVLANPGNLVKDTYTAAEVADLLNWYESGNVIKCKVGGGNMGHPLAHENEAPFSLEIAEFFVLSFCPPDGIVYDPFSGSGTTLHAAVENRRRGLATDARESQVALTRKRVQGITPRFFVASDERKKEADAQRQD